MPRQADERKFTEWRSRLARHAKSGLTVAGFCEREGVAVATFHYWRRKCQGGAATRELPRAEFAPVEVVHGSGVTIRFPGGAVMVSAHHRHGGRGANEGGRSRISPSCERPPPP